MATLATTRSVSTAEVIVVDGGSEDDTVAIAESFSARVLITQAGRARQMNAGATEASGAVLLFLHADTRLPIIIAAYLSGATPERIVQWYDRLHRAWQRSPEVLKRNTHAGG